MPDEYGLAGNSKEEASKVKFKNKYARGGRLLLMHGLPSTIFNNLEEQCFAKRLF
jgi:hypothetical protein